MTKTLEFKNKIPVAILGATGMVGQKFVELLSSHPWFKIIALAASERSYGKTYAEATHWRMPSSLDSTIGQMIVQPCLPTFDCPIVFSGLDANVAGEIEANFAHQGYTVISNSRNHRMHPGVPLIIPEVNPDHLRLVKSQGFNQGRIITNPNCSVIGLVTALKPLADLFGIDQVQVVTLQALSGAGYPGVASFDILDNVIPFIDGEEEKVEQEPLKILGTFLNNQIHQSDIKISAQCNRVAVMDGHMGCVSVKLKKTTHAQELIEAWTHFKGKSELPSSPPFPIIYHANEKHPQPKLHRQLGQGMAVSIGRLRKCPLLDWKFVILSHNTIRGAAGCAILNAELMVHEGYFTNGSHSNRPGGASQPIAAR